MSKCKQGYYYCYTDKKCKPISKGLRVTSRYFGSEKEPEEVGIDVPTNGNGESTDGGGVSESIISEKRDGKSAKDKGYSLRDWFKGGGWKQTGGKYDGKPCAKQPGQTTKPYCRDADDRAAMSKDKRDKAAAKKRKEDPNPHRKGKAIMVTQNNSFEPEANIVEEEKKKKMTNESKDLKKIAKELHGASKMHKKQAKRVEKHIKDMHKEEKQPKNCGCGKNPCMTYGKKKKSHDCASKVEHKEYGIGDCIKEMHTLDSTGNVTHYDVMFEHGIEKNVFVGDLNILVSEMHEHVINADKNKELLETKDKKGKGSGTKDACYHKVKSRYSVWPSAYASGALVKCRKVGAANWGNKSEEMDYRSFAAKAKETIEKNKKKTLKGETKTKKEEWIVDNAAQYFFNEGINEEGLVIFIEELGVENFVEFVHDLAEDSELIEAYALTGKKKTPKRLPKGTQPAKTTKATIARGDRTIKAASPSGAFKKRPAAAKAVETAKKQQPKKRPVLDGIARQVLKGMDRHNKAMERAKQDIKNTKKIAAKIGTGAKEFGKGVRTGLNTTRKFADVARKAVTASESVQYSDWRDDFKAMEYEFIDLIKPEPLVSEGIMPDPIDPKKHKDAQKKQKMRNLAIGNDNPNEKKVAEKKAGGPKMMGEGKYSSSVRATYGGKTETFPVEVYKKKSKKVKEEVETIDEAGKKCWKGYKKAGTQKLFGKTYNRCVKANEEFVDEERSARRAKNPRKYADVKKEIDKKEHQTGKITNVQKYDIEKKERKAGSKYTNFSGKRMTGSGGHGSENRVNPRISYIHNNQYEMESDWRSEIEEGAAWTKKSGKNPSGGLNEKGRKSYERQNPGSDLKRPSKKKGNKRRKSFCARMKGMKKKLTSKKTANDPNSRINKSLRAWNC